jgi:hypothetical protein
MLLVVSWHNCCCVTLRFAWGRCAFARPPWRTRSPSSNTAYTVLRQLADQPTIADELSTIRAKIISSAIVVYAETLDEIFWRQIWEVRWKNFLKYFEAIS